MDTTYNTVANSSSLAVRWYWATVGFVLSIGFALNYIMIQTIPVEAILAINPWVLIIGYFVSCILGMCLSRFSDNPLISFIGFLLVVVPVGVVITPFIQSVDPEIVQKAVVFTGLLTVIMGAGGITFPKLFSSIGGMLFWLLLAAIIAEIIFLMIGYKQTFMDYIVAVVFLGFIGYDFAQALDDEPTMDAAIDRAVALYLNIINLFMRILSIMKDD